MRNGGSIVNVASATALSGSQGFVHYVVSKGAVVSPPVRSPTSSAWRRIRVQLRRPRLHDHAGFGASRSVRRDPHSAWRVMEPADLLGTFCYLLSDDSAFVSGQTVVVDGGRQPH